MIVALLVGILWGIIFLLFPRTTVGVTLLSYLTLTHFGIV